MKPDNNLGLSDAYTNRLAARYGDIGHRIADRWEYALLRHQSRRKLTYLPFARPNPGAGERPALYVPGFTEGIVAKAPFVADLASRGVDIIMPGQNRVAILKDAANKKNATHSQALNYMAVLEHAGLHNEPVDIITHSYGSVIFDAMHRLAAERNWKSFEGSKVIMLAPAGTYAEESLLRLGVRFAKSMRSESGTPKEFHDVDGEMMKAGTKNFTANIPRAVREIFDLARNKVDYHRLLDSGISSLAIAGYAGDMLFSHDHLETVIAGEQLLDHPKFSYHTPVSLTEPWRYGNFATHNDEQFNPSRVGGAVAELLAA